MSSPSALRPKRCHNSHFWIGETTVKQWQLNRFLYSLVGKDWRWRDKAQWPENQWREYAESETLRTFVAYYDGSVAGYYELRSDANDEIEIAIFGMAPGFIGRGLGGALLTHAVQESWKANPKRVWLHTCNFDHPHALPNYLARGFSIYRVEGLRPTELI